MTKKPQIHLILTPSAKTVWDEAGRLQGASDLPPCPAGLAALDALIVRAAAASPTAILTATDEASIETASRLAHATGLKPRLLKALAEPSLGLWEGLQESTVIERHPTTYRIWSCDPARVAPPEGSEFNQSAERIIMGLVRFLEKTARTRIAVVARPMARAILSSWVRGEWVGNAWPPSASSEAIETIILEREAMRTPATLRTHVGVG